MEPQTVKTRVRATVPTECATLSLGNVHTAVGMVVMVTAVNLIVRTVPTQTINVLKIMEHVKVVVMKVGSYRTV